MNMNAGGNYSATKVRNYLTVVNIYYDCITQHKPPCPRSRDILYNNYSSIIHASNVDKDKVSYKETVVREKKHKKTDCCSDAHNAADIEEKITIVECGNCGSELGVQSDGAVQFWSPSLVFKSDNETVSVNEEVVTEVDCFYAVLICHVADSFNQMPQFMLCNRSGDKTHVWVIDKKLRVLTTVNQEVLDKNVIKILYKTISSGAEVVKSSERIDLSDDLYKSGLKSLEDARQMLPQSFCAANGFHVGYIFK